jgi:Ca2+-binding RTX toxin-like protein
MAQIIGNPWGETLVGSAFADFIDALGGHDTVFGRAGDDTLLGGNGNDVLVGDTGSDTVSGGAGADQIVWNNGDGSDRMDGGQGYDPVVVNGSVTDGDNFTIAANGARVDFDRVNLIPFSLDIGSTEELRVNGGGGNDTMTGGGGLDGLIRMVLSGGTGHDQITGGDGADVLNGDWGQDTIVGFRGSDTMSGGAGADQMIWNNGDGSDRIDGGQGYDTVTVNGSVTDGDDFTIAANGARVDFDRVNLIPFSLDIGSTEELRVNGGGGDDTMTGGAGLDGLIRMVLSGGTGHDRITGGDGADEITGNWGHDTLTGFRGSDTMDGGSGNDRMIWNNGDGSDRMDGGQGYDTVVVNGSDTDGDSFTIAGNGARVDFDRVNLIPFSLDIGSTEVLRVNGGQGHDTIRGGNGLDGKIELELNGGAGWDVLRGGDGDDVLTGGSGSDTFVFGRGEDTITDFQNGQDKIQFAGFGWLNDIGDLVGRVHDTGADVVIDLGTHELTIENVNPGIFDASDFIF